MPVFAAGLNSGAYKLVLVLHIMCAIVGFGAVFLNGLYAAQVRAYKGREGLAISEANYEVSRVAEYAIYAVFVFGLILAIVADRHFVEFSDAWLNISMILYIVGLGLSHGVLIPSHRKMNELLRAGNRGTELDAAFKRAAATGGVLNLLLAVILFLMVFKPGGTKF